MKPEDIRQVSFARPSLLRRGYDERAVDELLDRIEAHLTNPVASDLTAEDVRSTVLPKPPVGLRGYARADVDAFLDRVVQEWPTP